MFFHTAVCKAESVEAILKLDKFRDVNKFEELEMNKDSLDLALAEENLYDCIQLNKRTAWEKKSESDCRDKSNKFKFSSKGLNKRVVEDSGDVPMSKYRRALDEAIILTFTYRGFRTVTHMVATYEQTKKGQIFIQKDRFKMMEFIQNY